MTHVRTLISEVTVLAITHRRSVIGDADYVLDLGTGRRS
jgi:ATP-binding cassette, subfamily B, bacterial